MEIPCEDLLAKHLAEDAAPEPLGAGSLVQGRAEKRLQTLQHTTFTRSFYLKNLMVVGAATAASLCFGNAGYIYLTVAFVQILKAFTPVFVVAMLGLTGIETPSKAVVASVLMISVGTAIASAWTEKLTQGLMPDEALTAVLGAMALLTLARQM